MHLTGPGRCTKASPKQQGSKLHIFRLMRAWAAADGEAEAAREAG